MKVVGYIRVSTAAQAEDGFGLDVQRQAVKKWARDHGHKLVAILADEGISGAKGPRSVPSGSDKENESLDDRPALGDALAMIANKEAEGIVVPKLDRLARDLIIQETVLGEIWRAEGQVFSCLPGEDGYLVNDQNDPSRNLIRQVLGAVSEYERSVIALRLSSGRRRKHEAGGYAYGSPPVGFSAVGRELVKDPKGQEALRLIKTMRAKKASIRDICKELDAKGIPTKAASVAARKAADPKATEAEKEAAQKKAAAGWQPAVVGRIINRELASAAS